MDDYFHIEKDERVYLRSSMRDELEARSAERELLPFREFWAKNGETIKTLGQFLVCAWIVSYFTAQYIVYLVDQRQPAPTQYIANHHVITLKN